jgi:hypothetical protein
MDNIINIVAILLAGLVIGIAVFGFVVSLLKATED